MIQNDQSSITLRLFVVFLHEFRLGLLFLVSGIGVCFALRHRDRMTFFRDRARRLLLPLVFGVVFIVPPMVFLEMRFLGRFAGSLFEFYMAIPLNGIYPYGFLSWHHYWFVAYLFLFCMLGWPVFSYCRSITGRRLLARWSRRLARGYWLYAFALPLTIVEIPLRAAFPGFRDLIHDWASFSHWFLLFVAGFILAESTPLLDRAQAVRKLSLALAILATGLLFATYWSPDAGLTPIADGQVSLSAYLGFCALRMANAWLWLLACLGYAGRHLNRPSGTLTYLNEAVYPIFCVHLTILVAVEYLVVPLSWPIALKYAVITTATIVIALTLYELLLRRIGWIRPLVGMPPEPSSTSGNDPKQKVATDSIRTDSHID